MACKLAYDRQCRVGTVAGKTGRATDAYELLHEDPLLPETSALRELQRARNIVRNDPETSVTMNTMHFGKPKSPYVLAPMIPPSAS
jgi:hypothetical protein